MPRPGPLDSLRVGEPDERAVVAEAHAVRAEGVRVGEVEGDPAVGVRSGGARLLDRGLRFGPALGRQRGECAVEVGALLGP